MLIGLAERRIRLTGHPRLRARARETLLSRRRRERVLTGSVGLLLLLVLGGWAVLRSPLLEVEQVAVVGVETARADAVREIADVVAGRNVLDVDLEAVERRVDALPWVDRATVRRRLPSTVEIRLAVRQPVLVGTIGQQAYLIDSDGVVIGRQEEVPPGLPTLALTTAPAVGSAVDGQAVGAVVQVAASMPKGLRAWVVGYDLTEASQVDALLRLATDDGPLELRVHLGRPVDVQVKAATIASLVAETLRNGMRPTGFDVRIPDRPVVLV